MVVEVSQQFLTSWVIFSASASILFTLIGYFFIKADLDGIIFAQIGGWTAIYFLRKLINGYITALI